MLLAQTGPGGIGSSTTNVLWLSADYGAYSDAGVTPAVNNDNVRQWNDRSGNGKNASQATSGNRPNYLTNTVNSLPAIRFTSTNSDVITSTAVSTTNNASVWAVVSYVSLPSSNPGIIQAAPSGLSNSTSPGDKVIGLWVNNGSGTRVWGRGVQSNSTSRDISQVTTLSASTFYIVNSIYRTARIDQYVNNYAAGNNTSHNGTLRSWADVAIGRQGAESWNGNIAEIIFFNTEVNSAQRIIIDNYLSAKYGLTLGANDIYTQDQSGNGNYDFEVAGIGRVDASNTHSDAQGTSIVRILNPSGLGDNEFLIWGHDNGTQKAIETSDVPTGVQSRFDRVWRVNEANASGTAVDVGSIDIRWDLTGLGSVTASDLRLLADTDNDGVFSDETPISGATSLGSNIYAFTGVTAISNNTRFTLATIDTIQTPLPVELVRFDADLMNENVMLNWQTASERQNDFFTPQRSVNGQIWQDLGQIEGNGNSASQKYYTFSDSLPLHGISYYRIRQTDFDGRHSYSTLRKIEFFQKEQTPLTLYPNPAVSMIFIKDCSIPDDKPMLFDVFGRSLNDFQSYYDPNSNNLQIDISALNPGLYFIRTDNNVLQFLKNKN